MNERCFQDCLFVDIWPCQNILCRWSCIANIVIFNVEDPYDFILKKGKKMFWIIIWFIGIGSWLSPDCTSFQMYGVRGVGPDYTHHTQLNRKTGSDPMKYRHIIRSQYSLLTQNNPTTKKNKIICNENIVQTNN